MRIPKTLRKPLALAAGLLFLVFLAGILMNSSKYTEISVRRTAQTAEPSDPSILGLGAETKHPDYNVLLRLADRWVDCGTYADRQMGEGLTFTVGELAPTFACTEVRLQEKDKLDSDLLEQIPITSDELAGNEHAFTLRSRFDFQAGVWWFFHTTLGRILALGLLISIVLVALTGMA